MRAGLFLSRGSRAQTTHTHIYDLVIKKTYEHALKMDLVIKNGALGAEYEAKPQIIPGLSLFSLLTDLQVRT